MVKINYKNIELESLFNRGKSTMFKAVMSKKMFMQAIYSFKSLLSIMNNVIELKPYKYLNYQKNSTFSIVTIEGAGLIGNLVFSEEEQGSSITLYELIIN